MDVPEARHHRRMASKLLGARYGRDQLEGETPTGSISASRDAKKGTGMSAEPVLIPGSRSR